MKPIYSILLLPSLVSVTLLSNVFALDYPPRKLGQTVYGLPTAYGGRCYEEPCYSIGEAWEEHEQYVKEQCTYDCTLHSRSLYVNTGETPSNTPSIAREAFTAQMEADGRRYWLYKIGLGQHKELWSEEYPNGYTYYSSPRFNLLSQFPWGCETGATFITSDFPYVCRVPGSKPNHDLLKGESCPANQSNPINTFTGNKFQEEPDFSTSLASGLRFTRYFNSPSAYSYQHDSLIGTGWTHTYQYSLYHFNSDKPSVLKSSILLDRPTGKTLFFQLINGNWTNAYESDSPDMQLVQITGGWQLTHANGDIETYDNDGRIVSLVYRNGQSLSFNYEQSSGLGGDGNPETLDIVSDTFGNFIRFQYNDQHRITQVTDPEGNIYHYIYDSSHRLVRVDYPNQTDRQYVYEDSNLPNHLTGIIDENGERYATWAYDSQGRGILSEHAGGIERVTLSYGSNSTTVTDSLNGTRTYEYTVVKSVPMLDRIVGDQCTACGSQAQAMTHDANGFKTSSTDWNGNVTQYVHNSRGLETSRTEAYGTPQSRVISTAWHSSFNLPVRIAEPGKETVFTYDNQGRLLSRTERDL